MQTPWDSVFIFDETVDVLDSWEELFIDGLERHCPWRTKRVAWVNQAPWITPAIIYCVSVQQVRSYNSTPHGTALASGRTAY